MIGTEAIGEATFAGLEGHVEGCPDCQKILEAVTNAVPAVTNAVPQATRIAPTLSTPPTLPGLIIERELGWGSTSVVYLAWELSLNRHVAVKLFPRNTLVDPRMREHWLGEARALSRVPHDRVVAIHRVDETEEWLWLVIEYVSGGTLKDRLAEPLPPRDAARLAETIARAVGYFHSRGLSHLDLKPSNILLDGEPGAPWEFVSPKISDFGIARIEGEPGATETGANGPKGTPSYMAPEQVAAIRGTIGPAADLYALGALLYHLLTGRPPFQGATIAETLDQVRTQDPAPPRRINSLIPRDLETICLICLEKEPNRRYRTAEALAGDLRLWLEGHPIKARRISAMGHAWRLCRRHPAVSGLLVALAMTLVTGVVGLLVLLRQAEAERERLAEARHRAEAYERFSASTADQLGLFLRTTIRMQRNATPGQMIESLLRLRNSAIDLRNRRILPSATLGILEEEIAWSLFVFDRTEEARDLMKQAIADLRQSSAKNPEDKEARLHLGEALELSGELAVGAGQLDEALVFYDQTFSSYKDFDENGIVCGRFAYLYKNVQELAERLRQSGRAGQEERLRALGQQIFRHMVGSDLRRSMDEYPWDVEVLGRLIQRFDLEQLANHENKGDYRARERSVSQWLALSVGPLNPFGSSSSAAKFDGNPEAGAVAIISALRERCSKLGLADSMVPAAVFSLANDATMVAGEQRRLGRFEDARATAARLMAIARRVVREYPDNAYSYRVLSEAWNHIKKNAFRSDDDRLAGEALGRAIEAAQRSQILDPGNFEARRHLERLTENLASTKTKENGKSSSPP
jgi:tetratricopeptide (TPR) repeat protein